MRSNIINDIHNAPLLHTEQVKTCLSHAYNLLGSCADDYHSINDVMSLVGSQMGAELEAMFINRIWEAVRGKAREDAKESTVPQPPHPVASMTPPWEQPAAAMPWMQNAAPKKKTARKSSSPAA